MRRAKTIIGILFCLSGMMLCWPQSSEAHNPRGATWDHIPLMSLNLNVNDPVDRAGLTHPWNNQAANALSVWGDSWLGNGNTVPGTAFIYNYNFATQNWCQINGVAWLAPTPGIGFLTPCGDGVQDAVALTVSHTENSRYTRADVYFNSASVDSRGNPIQWTTANPGALFSPYNFNSVAIHEFGHALGLLHEDDTLAMMNSFSAPNPGRLHADDRRGVRSLYPGSGTETDIGPSVWKGPADCGTMAPCLVSSPTSAAAGQAISLDITQENFGTTDVVFNTGVFLSTNNIISPSDILLSGRSSAFQAAGTSFTFTAHPTIPLTTPPATYYLGVCLDDNNVVAESNEYNNCVAYPQTIQVTPPLRPDLRIRLVSAPPGTADPVSGAWVFARGASFSMTDWTENIGTAAAGGSTTRYRLSIDPTFTATDTVVGTRSVSSLSTTVPSSIDMSAAVTVTMTAAPGAYFLGACADDGNVLIESDESNNCRVAALIQVIQPNLRVTSVSDPPASVSVGTPFSMTDTTQNVGTGEAAASATRYRLSTDATITGGPSIVVVDPLLTGSRAIGVLAAATGTSAGIVSVTIPATIPTSTYYLGACADQGYAVAETNEFDNCLAASTTVQVINPMIISDLVIDSVSLSATSVTAGSSVSATDTTANIGSGPTLPASTTQYRLSNDSNITSADLLLGSRSVTILDGGTRSIGTVSVTIPSTVARGAYFLGACGDGKSVVAESNEKNNCRATPITVQ